MRKLQIISIIVVLFLTVGCRKRLDNFLFNNDNSITEYKLDNYGESLSLELLIDYLVPCSDINMFKYIIKDEDKSLDISAIFVGNIDKISSDTAILYCHGNKDHMDYY